MMINKKVPVALFLTAGLIAGSTLLRDDPSTAGAVEPLPDPEAMLASGYGYDPLDEVAATWRVRVQENPGDYLSRTQLGRSLLGLAKETGDLTLYERAEAQLQVAAEAAPNDAPAQMGLAASLSAQHEFADALDILEAVHDARPDDLGVQAAIADAHIDLGDYDAAFALLDDVVEQHPDTVAVLSRQARVAALTGDNEGAVDYARRTLIRAADFGLRPSEAAGMWFQLAFFEYQAGMVDDAATTLRSGLSIDPGHLGSREMLGKVLVALGRLEEAAALYEDILDATPAADLHGLLAEVYDALGRPDDAREQVQLGAAVAEEQIGRFPAERRHLAGFFADHDPATFLELMEEDVATRQDVGGLDLLAWARYLNGDLDGAREAMSRAMALGSRDAPLLFHAGMIAAASGEDGEARELLETALELNPGFDIGDVALAQATLEDL